MAIVGGAFLPSLFGHIADVASLRAAYAVPLAAYLGISVFGFAAARSPPAGPRAAAAAAAH